MPNLRVSLLVPCRNEAPPPWQWWMLLVALCGLLAVAGGLVWDLVRAAADW
jgi:hypothetical protein